jgi:4-amino-4-deoxy-L-arabinose transferase-like glycosyltransferase
MREGAAIRGTPRRVRLLRVIRDYVLLPAVGLVLALAVKTAVEDEYTAVSLYCWQGMRVLRLASVAYLAFVAALAFWTTRSFDSRARKAFTTVWSVGATAVILGAVYVEALLARSCNE